MKQKKFDKKGLISSFLVLVVFVLLSASCGLVFLGFLPQAEGLGVIIYFSLGGILILKLVDYVKNP